MEVILYTALFAPLIGSVFGIPFGAKRKFLFVGVFRTDRIRNVVLLGHGGAGKTSLVEAMAYLSGITSRLGKVKKIK